MTKPQPRRVNLIPIDSILRYTVMFILLTASLGICAAEPSNVEQDGITQHETAEEEDNIVYVDDGIVVIVGSPFVELYTFPGRGYPRFHAIEKNERIRIFKNRSDWYKIETEDGKIGWAPRKRLNHLLDLDGTPLDFASRKWGETTNRWQLGLLGGFMEGVPSYSVYVGYQFTPNISTEFKFSQTFGDSSTVKQAHLMLVHKPFPRWRLTPFFTLGVGAVKILPFSTQVINEDLLDPALTVGGGLMFYLTHNVLLRADYNSHIILTTREHNEEVEEWKAGFSVLF